MTQEMKSTQTEKKVLELTDEEMQTVAGGRKSGEGQKDFLVVRMREIFVT